MSSTSQSARKHAVIAVTVHFVCGRGLIYRTRVCIQVFTMGFLVRLVLGIYPLQVVEEVVLPITIRNLKSFLFPDGSILCYIITKILGYLYDRDGYWILDILAVADVLHPADIAIGLQILFIFRNLVCFFFLRI